LGLGIPLMLALAGLGLFLCFRNRRQLANQYEPNGNQPSMVGYPPSYPGSPPPQVSIPAAAVSISPVLRKPVRSSTTSPSPVARTSELGGNGVQRELGGMEVHPFRNISPNSPAALPGEHEMSGEGWRPELQGQPRSPHPGYYEHSRTSQSPHNALELP
jgi:hypothetical protein